MTPSEIYEEMNPALCLELDVEVLSKGLAAWGHHYPTEALGSLIALEFKVITRSQTSTEIISRRADPAREKEPFSPYTVFFLYFH